MKLKNGMLLHYGVGISRLIIVPFAKIISWKNVYNAKLMKIQMLKNVSLLGVLVIM